MCDCVMENCIKKRVQNYIQIIKLKRMQSASKCIIVNKVAFPECISPEVCKTWLIRATRSVSCRKVSYEENLPRP